ncbi:hypothetical protein DSO57_1008289 [Entomophthora muscae]|uniref:Uncharacterized protein n=1 Tax=Entomophthora muscae TaxID=34485 RepID=A0ACC2US56_9FUNG|nr:hypothetical protein DSO57_1008289 [Entomophthora muscae]
MPSPKGWRTLGWHLVENPPDASRVALDSRGRISSSFRIRFHRFGFPQYGGIRKTKTGKSERDDYGICRNRPVSLPMQP